MAQEVRIGVIGVGGMGSFHAGYLKEGKVPRARLAAVCDIRPGQLEQWDGVKKFDDSARLIRSGEVDAVMIATPHYFHTTIGIDAMQNGIHVLSEKPISVHVADAKRLIAAHTDRKVVFTAMHQMRNSPVYRKVKRIIESGELGEMMRINWIITNWFRSQAYYNSSEWRATWRGEGGGVLMNQCPHNLDLFAWFAGMPQSVQGHCSFGKYHDIEVEDDVTAYFEYANGATGCFITSTGEAPGSNRLEICGDRGRLVVENGCISFNRTEVPVREFSRTTKEMWATVPDWNIQVPAPGSDSGHAGITRNFVDAILDGAPLTVRGEEGLNAVELANGIIYSSLTGQKAGFPLDGEAYEAKLRELIAGSRFVKKSGGPVDKGNLESSFK